MSSGGQLSLPGSCTQPPVDTPQHIVGKNLEETAALDDVAKEVQDSVCSRQLGELQKDSAGSLGHVSFLKITDQNR